jgi:hypothetical protein
VSIFVNLIGDFFHGMFSKIDALGIVYPDKIHPMTEQQSPLASKIMDANPNAYRALVVKAGTPAAARDLLDGVKAEQLLTTPVKSQVYAEAMLAGLWLWNDGLEECHHIVQNSPEGDAGLTYSFWHAIMHRREGDFSNSKYWYRRAVGHPVMATLTGSAGALVNRAPADKSLLRIVASDWNPNALVDLVESVHGNEGDARREIAVQLQQMEWRVIWEHCARLV